MQNNAISDGNIKASSQFTANHAAYQGRLFYEGTGIKFACWSAGTFDTNQWLQVDLGVHYTKVTIVATQGRGDFPQWVTKYKLQYSNDELSFQYYKEEGQNVHKVIKAVLRRPKAATQSPIPIVPMHSLSYGPLRQQQTPRGRLGTYDDDDDDEVAQDGTHTCQLLHCLRLFNLILEIHFMVN